MGPHVTDRLLDALFGVADAGERATVAAHCAACPACGAAAAALTEGAGALTAGLPPIGVSPTARARLLAALDEGAGRFAPLVADVARLFDLAAARTIELLRGLDRAESWEPTAMPGMALLHLDGGPAVAGADVGFVRFAPGSRFPPHGHLGEERALMLQGGVTLADGTRFRRGEIVVARAGEHHAFVTDERLPTIYALVLWEGIELGGVPVRARAG